ncbi:glutathione S-transferase [Roseomonas sp. GC11]|uniref:glutathione S-transferase family protein n=1 Tax=Roseomonas sp. GC11 TaxID=2950546 RepID=UPI002108E1DF|nr:glutathione S-transferase [Roseomonas sp. GC11]MCQ4158373.1 glutathione S-transferase [Roseomonas sp. GC11]
MRIIWGRANSSNVMKLLWFCAETGLPYERRDAGGAFGRTQEPAYKAMNPMSLVPVLEEPDGWALWESNSILRYLGATTAEGAGLYPAAPRRRAAIERWMDWQLAHLSQPMTTLFFTHVRIPEPERDWDAAEAARQKAASLWALLDHQLQATPFAEGEALTLADIALGPFIHRWFALPIERPDLPALRQWYEHLCERPGYATHIRIPMT